MNHISDITKEDWFYSKPWILLGTGPSLNNFDYEKYKGHNIAAIYAAGKVGRADLLLSPDILDWDLNGTTPQQHRYIVTRAYNREKAPENSLFFEYDCDIANYPNPDHPIPYDGFFHGGDGKRYFPFHTPWPCACTAKGIMYFFGLSGIKTVYTCGIDGGSGIFDAAPEKYKDGYVETNNFDGEVKDLKDTANYFNITLIRI